MRLITYYMIHIWLFFIVLENQDDLEVFFFLSSKENSSIVHTFATLTLREELDVLKHDQSLRICTFFTILIKAIKKYGSCLLFRTSWGLLWAIGDLSIPCNYRGWCQQVKVLQILPRSLGYSLTLKFVWD